jgi:hypothetical protein
LIKHFFKKFIYMQTDLAPPTAGVPTIHNSVNGTCTASAAFMNALIVPAHEWHMIDTREEAPDQLYAVVMNADDLRLFQYQKQKQQKRERRAARDRLHLDMTTRDRQSIINQTRANTNPTPVGGMLL